ncbi:MarR family winged helix-turn-helix transcriptional regulator [Peribacillus loiseleuriae]|uniref:MarR family winged helix-turn-helix transcriptional regulator n=1 Tax=Peribacillus loiseleuriae TaxID=1679170 RepID=UPI0037FE3DC0
MPNSKETKVLLLLNELVVNIETTFGKCMGISQSRLEIMIQLFECGEISQSQLQKTLKIDSSAITRHLQQLELNGKINRRKSESDNRITLVSLTDLGKDQMSGLWNEKIVFVKNMLEGFSEKEIDLTLDYLNRIQINMNKINSDRENKGTS